MTRHFFKGVGVFIVGAALTLSGCGGDDKKETPPPTPAGAGFKLEIQSATVPASGAPTVTLKATDTAGNPVDLIEELKADKVAPRFSIATRDANGVYASLYSSDVAGKPYIAVEGDAATAAALATAPQASYKPGRDLTKDQIVALYTKVSDGVFKFTFPAAPAAAPATSAIHTVGVWGTRTFEQVGYPASASYSFTPATGAAAAKREIVSDAACNVCHKNMQAHDSRRTVELCVTCHNAGTKDPESGNDVDFAAMIHKIHAAKDYFIVGYAANNPATLPASSVHDYSHVVFPPGNSVKNCATCHQGAQAASYKDHPTRAACGACHDTVDFATGAGHSTMNLPQADDTGCAGCHKSTVEKVHSALYDAATNTQLVGKKLEISIDDVTGVDAGATPTVKFTVKVDGQPYDAKTNKLASLRFTLAGPTSDYSGAGKPSALGYAQSPAYGGATGSTDLLVSTGTPGQFTAPLAALASDAAGSIGVGVEAYIAETVGTVTRNWNATLTPVFYAKIGGGTAEPRRTIVSDAKCNACHVDLGFHGNESRKGVQYCAMCHNPNNVNDERTSQYEVDPVTGAAYSKRPESVSIMQMAHKLHAGSALSKTYTLGTDRSLTTDPKADETTFAGAFPGDLADCQSCHEAGTYGLPASTNLPTRSALFTCSEAADADTNLVCASWTVEEAPIAPMKAACMSCHDSDTAVAHADGATNAGAEGCAACHGPGMAKDPLVVHQPRP